MPRKLFLAARRIEHNERAVNGIAYFTRDEAERAAVEQFGANGAVYESVAFTASVPLTVQYETKVLPF